MHIKRKDGFLESGKFTKALLYLSILIDKKNISIDQ